MPEKAYPITVTYMFDGEHEVHIRKRISFTELNTAVSTAIESMYDEDGTYQPVFRDFVVPYVIVENYTDYFDEDSMKNFSIDKFMELIQCSDFFGDILEEIDEKQYFSIQDMVEEGIKYRNSRSESDKFFKELNGLLVGFKDVLTEHMKPENIKNLLKQANQETED